MCNSIKVLHNINEEEFYIQPDNTQENLENITVEKAILVSKQLCIDFSYDEMNSILPYIKNNWQNFLNENKKTCYLDYISTITSPLTAKKANALLNKLLIILS